VRGEDRDAFDSELRNGKDQTLQKYNSSNRMTGEERNHLRTNEGKEEETDCDLSSLNICRRTGSVSLGMHLEYVRGGLWECKTHHIGSNNRATGHNLNTIAQHLRTSRERDVSGSLFFSYGEPG